MPSASRRYHHVGAYWSTVREVTSGCTSAGQQGGLGSDRGQADAVDADQVGAHDPFDRSAGGVIGAVGAARRRGSRGRTKDVGADLDAFSPMVIGWSIADHMRADVVVDALQLAIWRRRPPAGKTIARSDPRMISGVMVLLVLVGHFGLACRRRARHVAAGLGVCLAMALGLAVSAATLPTDSNGIHSWWLLLWSGAVAMFVWAIVVWGGGFVPARSS